MEVAGPYAPKVRSEDYNGQEKEDTGDFEPQDTTDAAKGPEKAAHATGNASAGLTGGSAGRSVLGRAGGRGCTGCHALAGDATGDAQPYT
jgi:hypothetical protein